MRGRSTRILSFALCSIAAYAAAAAPLRITLDRAEVPVSELRPYSEYGYHRLEVGKKPGARVTVPPEAGKGVLYGTLPLAGDKAGLSFALAKGLDSDWYERLFIDWNEDGQFNAAEVSSTTAVVGPKVQVIPSGSTTPVVSNFRIDLPSGRGADVPADYAFVVQVSTSVEQSQPGYLSSGTPNAFFFTAAYRKGMAVIDGARYQMMLMDSTANGRFDDFARLEDGCWTGDSVVFLPEGETPARLTDEMEPLNALRAIGKTLYRMTVSANGADVTLDPDTTPCGRIATKNAPAWIDLAGDQGVFRLRPQSAVLPAGTYTLARKTKVAGYMERPSVHFAKTTEDGTKWELWGAPSDSAPSVVIKPGKQVELPFGAPFTTHVKYEARDGAFSMKVELAGQAGEAYRYSHVAAGGNSLPTGPISIKDGNGKTLATVPRSVQQDADAIAPDYLWKGSLPKTGAFASCDLGLPWKTKAEETLLAGK